MLRLLAVARLALTFAVALVVGLGVLGSSRVASACMRKSLAEAPCCAALRAPVRLETPESCCRAGRLGQAPATDLEAPHGAIADAHCVAQPAWTRDGEVPPAVPARARLARDRARPPPHAPHLAFTVLRC